MDEERDGPAAPAECVDERGAAEGTAASPPDDAHRDVTTNASDDDDDDDEEPYRDDEDTDEDDDDDDKSMYRLHDLVEQGAIHALRLLLPLKSASPSASATGAAAADSERHDDDSDDNGESRRRNAMQVMATESLLLEKDDMGCLPIHVAILHQQRACTQHLLQYSDALTSAMLRIKCGDLGTPIVHLILRVGALNAAFATALITELFDDTPDAISSDDGASTSTLAARWSDDVKALLFERLAAKDEEGNSVFHLCAMYDLSVCLATLAAFYTRQVAQHHARSSSGSNSKKLMSLHALLEKGNRVGARPLHAAMKFQSLSVARQLVRDFDVSRASVTTLQQTPAHVAALAGFADGVALLLESPPPQQSGSESHAVDLALVDNHGYTARELAEKAQFTHVAQLLAGDAVTPVAAADTGATVTVRTKFYYHPESLRHLPMAYHRRGGVEPPPENPERIDTLVDPVFGILRAREFAHVTWDYDIARADIADVLRVHEFHYVDKLRRHCEQLAAPLATTDEAVAVDVAANDDNVDDVDAAECGKTFTLDADTALSLRSYDAATRAAGAVCKAVDDVVTGVCDTAFCIVRPPGHHAGPVGKVVCANDPEGSHGFCLLNNVAVGAAYARAHYRSHGINRIAILDFDVHHGNGTEEIVRQLTPRTRALRFATPYGEGEQIVQQYKPWRSADDAEHVFFASVHGYGHKDPEHEHSEQAAWFYPGSGESTDDDASTSLASEPSPQIHNVGLAFCRDGASAARLHWRRAFRDDVLPKLRAFAPDLIFLSAGFDAHRKESVNWGYGALLEQDYEWLVRHVKHVAHACCHARVVSPFARSVAAHARALADPSKMQWDAHDVALEAEHERVLLATYSSISGSVDATAPAVHAVSVMSSKKKKSKRADGNDAGAEPSSSDAAAPHVPLAISRSKRARKDVDYVALAEEIAAQQQKDSVA